MTQEVKQAPIKKSSNFSDFIKDMFSLIKSTEIDLHVKDNIYKKDSENNLDLTLKTDDTTKTNIQISNQGKIKIKHEIT